jgi:hypothetical protein
MTKIALSPKPTAAIPLIVKKIKYPDNLLAKLAFST